jgi:hypothetical protein
LSSSFGYWLKYLFIVAADRRTPTEMRNSSPSSLSKVLIDAIRDYPAPQYSLAHWAEVNPCTLSHWIRGISHPRRNDRRVLMLAARLGVPSDQAFASGEQPQVAESLR